MQGRYAIGVTFDGQQEGAAFQTRLANPCMKFVLVLRSVRNSATTFGSMVTGTVGVTLRTAWVRHEKQGMRKQRRGS